jgi:hypothetical protein
MASELAVTATGAVVGMVVGGVGGWFISQHRRWKGDPPRPELSIPTEVDDQIYEAARGWAMAQGMPEATNLIARKLRLGLRLQARRRGRMS